MSSIPEKIDRCQQTTNILQAAEAKSALDAALAYHRLGYTIVPIANGEKYPAGVDEWQNVFINLTEEKIRAYYETGKFWGVGLRPGVLSNGLVMIDLDSPAAYEKFCTELPDLTNTYTERTRRGYHVFLEVEIVPIFKTGKLKVGEIEVFYNTGQVVVSPSPHPKGGHYAPFNRLPVKRIHDLDTVLRWVQAQRPANTARPAVSTTSTPVVVNGDVWEAIKSAANVTRFNADGWSDFRPCPFTHHEHDHTRPLFGLHENGYGTCMKCAQTANKMGLAAVYGIAWPQPSNREEKTNVASLFQNKDAPRVWFPALPDSYRTALLTYYPQSTAPLVELLTQAIAAGLIDPACFTVADLLSANVGLGFGIPQATLYRGVEALVGELFSKSNTTSSACSLVSEIENNSIRGRKRDCYSLLPLPDIKANILANASPRIDESAHSGDVVPQPKPGMMEAIGEDGAIAAELDMALQPAYRKQGNRERKAADNAQRERARLEHELENTHSTPLPAGWPLGSALNYRAAFTRVKVDPAAQTSRKEIASLVGVDPETVTVIRQRAGIKAVLKETWVGVESFDTLRTYGKDHRAFAKKLVAHTASGQTEEPAENESHAAFIKRQRSLGAKVTAHFQHTSTHEIVREAPPAPAERKPRERMAGMESRPAQHASEPKTERYYGRGYDPRWVMEKLKLALKLLTGEIDTSDDPRQLIEMILGRELSSTEEDWTAFLNDAAELGAVSSVRERTERPAGEGWQEVPLRRIA